MKAAQVRHESAIAEVDTMPCYLFTFHGYGTWMPDRKQGFVRRGKGVEATNTNLAAVYRKAQTESTVTFDEPKQSVIIDAVLEAAECMDVRPHYVATETTHVHVLVSWKNDKDWKSIRRSLRASLTRQLNTEIEKRTWLAKTGSRKRVEDQKHFDHLIETYLPSHRGLKWSEEDGLVGSESAEVERDDGEKVETSSDEVGDQV